MNKPNKKPSSPNFSSGPCKKYPGWSLDKLSSFNYGRSHRSKVSKALLLDIVNISRSLLELPDDFLLGLFVGSDTAAIEAALWNTIGQRPADCFYWESFGKDWFYDIKNLGAEVNEYCTDYGYLPDFSNANFGNDVIFTYNGTTSGVTIPDLNWIDNNRAGLTICDGTSMVFTTKIDWSKIDIFTYSWQKTMGGEAGHGMMVLSPRAVKRLEEYRPNRAIPKLFTIVENGKIRKDIFEGSCINTPSMLACVDALDAIKWMESIGLDGCIQRVKANYAILEKWLDSSVNFENQVKQREIRSNTSVCISVINKNFTKKSDEARVICLSKMLNFLEDNQIAYDINSFKSAPLGIRIWCGPTIEKEDLELLTKWLDWAAEEFFS